MLMVGVIATKPQMSHPLANKASVNEYVMVKPKIIYHTKLRLIVQLFLLFSSIRLDLIGVAPFRCFPVPVNFFILWSALSSTR